MKTRQNSPQKLKHECKERLCNKKLEQYREYFLSSSIYPIFFIISLFILIFVGFNQIKKNNYETNGETMSIFFHLIQQTIHIACKEKVMERDLLENFGFRWITAEKTLISQNDLFYWNAKFYISTVNLEFWLLC